MSCRMNRRGFLHSAARGAAGWLILQDSRSAWSYQANEKLNIALVGLGARGTYHLGMVPRIGQNLVAVCDANRLRVAEALKRFPNVRQFQDFRKMLDEMDRKIDAVIVATPEHTHAVIAARAMKRGKHVYVEKPMAHDVTEARTLRQIAKQGKLATQQGNQGMATDSFRRTLELIREGAIGEIREAHVWYVFGGSGRMERPKDTPSVPPTLDWDLFLGPAPFRPYHPRYVNGTGWGGWRDFGTGCLGGGGSHSINLAFKALNLRALWDAGSTRENNSSSPGAATPGLAGQQARSVPPRTIRVEVEIGEQCPENFPRVEVLHFDIPARGQLPPARIHWYNAPEAELVRLGIWQKLEKIAGRPLEWKDGSWTPRSGTLLVGSKGVVHTNAHNSVCALLPEKDFPNAGGPPKTMPHVRGHEPEWVAACKGGPAPLSNFEHSGPAIEMLLLGNVATLVGKTIEFDPVACKIAASGEADRALCPPHREGWAL